MSKLREAATAVYERWDSPLWKDLPHTGEYMQALCDALNEPDRLEVEYQAATLRIDNDLMVIAALTAERDAYAKAADDMAAAHKVERDALKEALDKFSEAEILMNDVLRKQLMSCTSERDALELRIGAMIVERSDAFFKVIQERDALQSAARLALDFVEFCWRDVTLNEFAEEKRATTEAALKAVL